MMTLKPLQLAFFTAFHVCCCAFQGLSQQPNPAKSISYKLDLAKSKIFWTAPKNHGGSKHAGYVLFNSGTLETTSNATPTVAKFSINMNSIKSTDNQSPESNQKLDVQLKSADFFEVAKFPKAEMSVSKIVPTKNPLQYTITGNLTMKGVVQQVQFMATIKILNNQIRVQAQFSIDRMKWNVKNMDGNLFGTIKNKMIDEIIPLKLDLLFNRI